MDDVLLYRAERVKNGQNIHRLNNLLCFYLLAKALALEDARQEAQLNLRTSRRAVLELVIEAEHDLVMQNRLANKA